ncbi:hypothetical protein BURMUCF2_1558 [Burkholderia multivorans CF2]|nr:hypothetical protein BURMUCF2_1558 [Burkholderia multivorans CF2]
MTPGPLGIDAPTPPPLFRTEPCPAAPDRRTARSPDTVAAQGIAGFRYIEIQNIAYDLIECA